MKTLKRILYSVAYTGFLPKMPGTYGALLATILVYFMAKCDVFTPVFMIALVVLSSIVSLWTYALACEESQSDDPSIFVIDEFAGICVTFVYLHESSFSLIVALIGFTLFRAFDILKPGPIGWVDRKKGALPVLVDDLIAGVFACLGTNVIVSLMGI